MAIIFDAETYRVPDAADFLDPIPEPPPVKADGRLTDAAKIAADLAKKEVARLADWQAAKDEQLAKCSLDPYTARIVTLGWSWAGEEIVHLRECRTESQEAEALREFWAITVEPRSQAVVPLIGFNSRTFDLPLMLTRSLLLGVKAPILNLDRWRSPHPDVMLALTHNGALKPHTLRWYARRFRLPMDDAFSGEHVGGLVEDGNFDAIGKHCTWDVETCKALAIRLGIIRPRQAVAA